MGRATRWLKALFGIETRETVIREYSVKEKRRSSGHSGVLCHNPTTIPPNITPAEAEWLRSFYSQPDTEQSKHARAVAAATAAAADAAVAAAQAAALVVRLTSQGCARTRENRAAANIQRVFRGHLARKARRALKGLVKIQALVRGFLVRKQAAAAFLGMQALIRAQAGVRAQKARRMLNRHENFPPQFQARMSPVDSSRRLSSSEGSPKIVEVDTGCWPKSRSRRPNPEAAGDESPAKGMSSPFSVRLWTSDIQKSAVDQEWGRLAGDECNFSTAQSTPRFASYVKAAAAVAAAPPAKSVSTDRRFGNDYTAAESLKVKQRSQSAPKQRTQPGPNRIMVRGKRSTEEEGEEAIILKNAVAGKLGRSSSFVRHNHQF